jgi:CHRD domain
MRIKLFSSAVILSGIVFFAACSKSDSTPVVDPNITFKGTLSGANEVPANASAASGSVTVTFNNDTKILTLAATFTGVTPTAAHIHNAAAGVNGGVIFGLGSAPFTSPVNYTSVALTPTQESELKANNYYANFHSTAFPGGEIRAQLIKQ